MKTTTNRIFYLLFFLLTATAFFNRSFAQGKKIIIGSGSGVLDYPNAQSTLNLHDDDTVLINAGKYNYMSFKNITASPGHKIYIINNGLVEFVPPLPYNSSPSTFSNLTNVEIKGNGTPGLEFGFYMHDLLRGIYIDGTMTSVYFSYMKMVNMSDYSIYIYNQSLVYDGTNNPNSLFYDMKFLHFSMTNLATSFIQIGTFERIIEDGLTNMVRKLEIAYCTVDYMDNQDVFHLNKVLDANVHHNRFSHIGKTNIGHSCIVYLYGSGEVHHNYINDYWGSGVRSHAFNLDGVGEVNIYNNVMVDCRKYSGIEAKATEAEDLYSSPYLHYCNFKVYNNTFGDFTATPDWHASMVDTFDFLGGTFEIKNNIGFNLQRDKPYDPTYNYVNYRLNIGIPDTSHNVYSPTAAALGIADDSLCFLNVNSPAIDKGLTFGLVADDIDGVIRPQGTAYDLGAHEYVTGVVYPIANAGADTSTTLPKDSIKLNGTASYDPLGGALTYKWSEVSGPSAVVFQTDSIVKPLLKNLIAGTYQLKLTVTNSQGRSKEDIVALTVNPAPVFPPIANAGGTTTITLPVNTTGLNGTASSNPAAGVLQYAWTKISGPASFTISGATTSTPVVSNLTEGTYEVKLTVTNSDGLTNDNVATVIVKPAPVPAANAGADINLVLPVNSTTLDGSASTTPAGGSLAYAWTKVSGPASFTISGDNTATASLSNLAEGVYAVKLVVTNVQGLTAEDQVTITVSTAPLVTPVANAGTDVNLVLPANSTKLDGTASSNSAGGTLIYAWTKISGPSSFTITGDNTATPAISNLTEGSYHVKLTVTNNQAVSAEDQVTITVSTAPLVTPVANAGADINLVLPANSTALDGTASSNSAGGTLIYAWTKVSGPASFTITGDNTATPAISNLTEGSYHVKLTVTNNQGVSAEDIVIVNVVQPAVPVAVAGPDVTVVLPASSVSLDGSSSYQPGGGTLTYGWTKISGPDAFAIARANTATPYISNLTLGVYKVQLTVTNAAGLTGSSVVTITVNLPLLSVPNAGNDTTINFPGGYAILDGSRSYATGGATITAYSWKQLSGPTTAVIASSGVVKTTATNLEPGVYVFQLTITDNNGKTEIATFKVTVVSTTRYDKKITLYPNPAADKLTVHIITDSTGSSKLRITSMAGIIMFTQSFQKNQLVVDVPVVVTQLPAGLYIVEVIIGNEVQLLGKFVKR